MSAMRLLETLHGTGNGNRAARLCASAANGRKRRTISLSPGFNASVMSRRWRRKQLSTLRTCDAAATQHSRQFEGRALGDHRQVLVVGDLGESDDPDLVGGHAFPLVPGAVY